jgi:hypothetical protein
MCECGQRETQVDQERSEGSNRRKCTVDGSRNVRPASSARRGPLGKLFISLHATAGSSDERRALVMSCHDFRMTGSGLVGQRVARRVRRRAVCLSAATHVATAWGIMTCGDSSGPVVAPERRFPPNWQVEFVAWRCQMLPWRILMRVRNAERGRAHRRAPLADASGFGAMADQGIEMGPRLGAARCIYMYTTSPAVCQAPLFQPREKMPCTRGALDSTAVAASR